MFRSESRCIFMFFLVLIVVTLLLFIVLIKRLLSAVVIKPSEPSRIMEFSAVGLKIQPSQKTQSFSFENPACRVALSGLNSSRAALTEQTCLFVPARPTLKLLFVDPVKRGINRGSGAEIRNTSSDVFIFSYQTVSFASVQPELNKSLKTLQF